ncbi:Aldo-keto reductase [Penicillium chermesinum]|nr:Aldo-keto reductase [Penicillium chermesinum]
MLADVFGQIFGPRTHYSKDHVHQGGIDADTVDEPLARLGTTYIDIQGKPAAFAHVSMWATTFAQMSWVAEKHGRTKFVSMQHHCSHFHVKSERWIASAKASANGGDCEEKRWPISCVALAWFKDKNAAPIVGASSVANIGDLNELKGRI